MNQPTTPPISPPSSQTPSPQGTSRRGRKNYKPDLAKIYPLETIPWGMETLVAIYHFRGLRPEHVRRMWYEGKPSAVSEARAKGPAQTACNRYCLRPLKDLRMVEVISGTLLTGPQGRSKRTFEILVLTKLGWETVTNHLGINPAPAYRFPTDELLKPVLNHWLTYIGAASMLFADATEFGWTVETVLDEFTIKSQTGKKKLRWGVEPDCLMIVKNGDTRHAVILEGDNGTEPIESDARNSLRTKALKYRDFNVIYRHQDELLRDLKQPTIHFIMPTLARALRTKAEFEAQGSQQAYWFTAQEFVQPPYHFLGPVWQVCGRQKYQNPSNLFKPRPGT